MKRINLQACPLPGCDVVWLCEGNGGSLGEDIEAFWKRDVRAGHESWVCASCYWRAKFLQNDKLARGLQPSGIISWADGQSGVGKDQPPAPAPKDEENWDAEGGWI